MNFIKRKNLLFIFLLVLLSIKLSTANIFKNAMEDDNYKKYYETTTGRKTHKKDHNYYNEYDFQEKPKTTFDFLYKSFLKRVHAYFDSFNDYFDGFNYILSNYKYLFRRYSGNKIINKTLKNPNKDMLKDEEKNGTKRHNRRLDEKHMNKTNKNKNKKIQLRQSYEYNNTDLYNKTKCPTSPNLKVFYYMYFCNGERVSQLEYEIKKAIGIDCEFYNNTVKLCFCPINYGSCALKGESKIKCMVKEIIVNDEINLTKYYDTFYEEFFKTPILDNEQKIFNFSVKLKCGMTISDYITGSDMNYYLSSTIDDYPEFDVISTMNDDNTEYEIQYTKEEVMNNTIPILNYFIKKKNLVVFKEPKLSIKFSLIDQQWLIPFRTKQYKVDNDIVEDFLSGESSFNFTVDINDIIENELGEGPFSTKTISYPYFDKGDMHFFEIEFKEEEEQLRLFPFRGEIKK